MSQTVPVLLLDDGELDDVQECLEELGVTFGRVRGGAIVRQTPAPTQPSATTPRPACASVTLHPAAPTRPKRRKDPARRKSSVAAPKMSHTPSPAASTPSTVTGRAMASAASKATRPAAAAYRSA